MKIIILILSLSIFCNAKTIYITPGSSNNKIVLSILNQDDEPKSNVKIEVVSAPSWLEFKDKQYIVNSVSPHSSVSCSFVFSPTKEAPINQEQTVNIELVDGTGSKFQKSYSIQVRPPVVFSLSQNYPNPFNPTTTISYAIPKASNVVLIVYDNLGREVYKLVDEYKEEGNYSMEFNANSLASGIYFYRLSAGNYNEFKKMLLLK